MFIDLVRQPDLVTFTFLCFLLDLAPFPSPTATSCGPSFPSWNHGSIQGSRPQRLRMLRQPVMVHGVTTSAHRYQSWFGTSRGSKGLQGVIQGSEVDLDRFSLLQEVWRETIAHVTELARNNYIYTILCVNALVHNQVIWICVCKFEKVVSAIVRSIIV